MESRVLFIWRRDGLAEGVLCAQVRRAAAKGRGHRRREASGLQYAMYQGRGRGRERASVERRPHVRRTAEGRGQGALYTRKKRSMSFVRFRP